MCVGSGDAAAMSAPDRHVSRAAVMPGCQSARPPLCHPVADGTGTPSVRSDLGRGGVRGPWRIQHAGQDTGCSSDNKGAWAGRPARRILESGVQSGVRMYEYKYPVL